MNSGYGADGDDPIPEIPGYRDLVLLGAGMSSTVWQAHQAEFDRPVAVKVLRAGFARGDARDRFEREKRISAKLGDHPFVVTVFATGTTDDGRPYMAMGLCERGSLADRLQREGSFAVDDVIDIGIKIAGAVQAAHDKGILHRDIKPGNILFSEYGPALSDWGISRATTGEMTATTQQLTPVFSAPEAFLDTPPTPQMDVYSLGATLFNLLAGLPAFPPKRNETYTQYMLRIERDPLPAFRRRDVPDGLRAVIERTMAKRPEDRYATARELSDALRALQQDLARSPDAPPDVPPTDSVPMPSTTGRRGTVSPDLRDRVSSIGPSPAPVTSAGLDYPSYASVGSVSDLGDDATVRRTPLAGSAEPRTDAPARSPVRIFLIAAAVVLLVVVLLVVVVTLVNPTGSENPSGRKAIGPKVVEPALAPTDLGVTRNGPKADLTWTAVGTSQRFLVAWRPQDADPNTSTRVEASDVARFTIADLDVGTRYCYQVIAVISLRTQSTPTSTCDAP